MIEIITVSGQTYYTVDLSKVEHSYSEAFKATISGCVNAKFYCIYSLGEIMLINCAILDGLINSGVLDEFRRFIHKQQ